MNTILSTCTYDTLTEAKIKEFLPLVSEERQARIQKLDSLDKKSQLLLAGLLTIKGLTDLSGLPREALEIGKQENGKPILKNAFDHKSNLGFSLSHTRGIVAFYGGRSQACGIDVEAMPPADDLEAYTKKIASLEGIAKRFFTADEIAFVYEGDTFLPTRFYLLWTKKEAYGKLTGSGLAEMSTSVLRDMPHIYSGSFHLAEKRAYISVLSTAPIEAAPIRYTAEALLESF